MTASPQQLHLLVVEGALRNARLARETMQQSDRAEAGEALAVCRDLLTELIGGLNPQHAPELAAQLKAMFTSMYYQLMEADIHWDAARVDKVIDALAIHRDTWLEVLSGLGQQAGTATASAGDAAGGATGPAGPSFARRVGRPGSRSWTA